MSESDTFSDEEEEQEISQEMDDEIISQQNNNEINNENYDDIRNENENDIINDDSNINDNSIQDKIEYYDSKKFSNLKVDNEIQRLFEYIDQYEYDEIELDTVLIPFVPNYIPCIGNVDRFIQPNIPDIKTLNKIDPKSNINNINIDLGINVLNEPCLNQSDPSTFDLKLRSQTKIHTNIKHIKIRSIKNAEKNSNKIKNWIDNINKIKKQTITNTNNIINLNDNYVFPDIEQLMQPWPKNIETYINDNNNDSNDLIPNYNIDLNINEYAKMICILFDIPIHDDKIIPSLHILFSLYSSFKSV